MVVIRTARFISVFAFSLLASINTRSQSLYEAAVEQQFSEVFAITAVLTDSEVITFGVVDFDPNEYLELDNDELGNDQSIESRNSLQIYTLPWQWDLHHAPENWHAYAKIRLGYLRIKNQTQLFDDEPPDQNRHQVYDLYSEYGWRKPLNALWQLHVGLGMHVMKYENRYRYRSEASAQYKPIFDGTLLNTQATALLAEPLVKLTYNSKLNGIPWSFHSTLSYSFGRTIRTESYMQEASPEAWRWANGAVFHFHMPEIFNTRNQIRFLARRIDVGGDVVNDLDTHYYYELGLGWLVDVEQRNTWFDNLGLGLSVDIGNSLSGGSVVLLYNETF